MTSEEIAAELKPEKPPIVRLFDWLRRHLFIRGGLHGNKSIEGGIRIEF